MAFIHCSANSETILIFFFFFSVLILGSVVPLEPDAFVVLQPSETSPC